MPITQEKIAWGLASFAIPLGVALILFFAYMFISKLLKKEPFIFLGNNKVHCDTCKKYYMEQYQKCVDRSGGVDANGDCWSQTHSNIAVCEMLDNK